MSVRELPKYISDIENYHLVDNVDNFVDSVLADKPARIALDTETYNNTEMHAPQAIAKFIKGSKNNCPFGASIFYDDKGFWIDHDLEKLAPLMEDKTIDKILHNSKYDLNMLLNLGVRVKGKIWDTMTMIQLIDEEFECNTPSGGKKKSKRLKDLAYHFLGNDAHELEDLVDEYRKIIASNMGLSKEEVNYKMVNDENPELMKDYAIADTEFTYKLYDIFAIELSKQGLFKAYETDINAMYSVINIERQGFRVDLELMQSDEAKLTEIIQSKEQEIYNIIGKEFNINSSAELVDALEPYVGDWKWFTEKGEFDTTRAVLQSFEDGSPESCIANLVIEYRRALKIRDTYITGVYPLIQEDGKVHADFWITPNDFGGGGTKTGRMSSSNPNLQNITKKPKEIDGVVFNVRDYYIADDEYILGFHDADQEEYRLLAHYGNDKNFAKMVHDGKDIHKGTAEMLFGVPYDEIDDDLRGKAKTLNFGLVYGLGNASFAKALGNDIDETLYRGATAYLYKKYKPWDIINYREQPNKYIMTAEQAIASLDTGVIQKLYPDINGAEFDEKIQYTIECIEYFFSEPVKKSIIEATSTKKKYFDQFPGINKFLKEAKNAGSRRGFVKTYTGRRRHFKDPNKESYKAPNSIIQGGCGEVMKIKIVEVGKFLNGKKSTIINTVHDELCIMYHKTELHLIPQVLEILQDLPFRVPITWGTELALRWGSKTEIEDLSEVDEIVKNL